MRSTMCCMVRERTYQTLIRDGNGSEILGTDIGAVSEHPVATAPGSAPLRVLIVAPSMDILGGQAVQAERLLAHLRAEPSLKVGFLPINPRLPGILRKLQAIKYVRTVVTSIAYVASLLVRVPG